MIAAPQRAAGRLPMGSERRAKIRMPAISAKPASSGPIRSTFLATPGTSGQSGTQAHYRVLCGHNSQLSVEAAGLNRK
jgi:hypothetical protein